MPDSPPSVQSPDHAPDAAAPLTPDAIERVLADFRVWLNDLAAVPPPADEPPATDLHTLVAQFTALRHEVNLQTKAARTSIEQNSETLKQLQEALTELRERPGEESDEFGPLLNSLVDVYDNLALALRQVERQRDAIDQPLVEVVDGQCVPEPPAIPGSDLPNQRPGFWARLLGKASVPPAFAVAVGREVMADWRETIVKESEARRQRVSDAATLVRSSLDGLIAGYRMSLARVDRAVTQAGLEPIAATGAPFDPELMEVVAVAGDTGRPAGEVIEEVRRGYLRGDVVFRYAQVRVAR
jgi:molecular chaperone GrpE